MSFIIIFLCLVALGWAIVYMIYFILGFFPFLSAKKLSEEDVENIKKYGVIHRTTSKGKNGIEKEHQIKGSKWTKTYSTHFRKGTYFFASAYLNSGESFNNNQKYEYIIRIENLTDRQIHNFMIRAYDKALIYKNDFVIEGQNIVKYESIQRNQYSTTKKLNMAVNKYAVAVLASIGVTIGILSFLLICVCKLIGII